jgi:RHS repeat-associated protein
VYDYLGRRIEKRVYDVPDIQPLHWDLVEVRRFVWSGWLVLMELDGLHNNQVLKKYTWGPDLAGSVGQSSALPAALQAAGGIGGLLALEDLQDPNDPNDNLDYVYLYDAAGNVGQLIDWSHDPNDPNAADAAIVARYEYDPYGNVTAAAGPYASANPFRWSTKYWDDETGFGYWGRRYYDAALGRWHNRNTARRSAAKKEQTRPV